MFVFLYFDVPGEVDLSSAAATVFRALGIVELEERESSNYVDEQYFAARSGGVVYEIALSDDEKAGDLRFWLTLEIEEIDGAAEARINALEDSVVGKLGQIGARVARVQDFGKKTERVYTLEEDLLQALLVVNWNIVRSEPGSTRSLPQSLVARYGALPSDYQAFLLAIESCVHPLEDAWFLGLQAFNGTSDSAFSWDELERQSLSAAEDDDTWQGEIRNYWDKVLPIALSVRSGYAYLGLRLDSDCSVVLGREPEFEDAAPIAASFSDLCRAIIGHLKGGRIDALADFL